MNNNFDDIVFNRHSVKAFDANTKISKEEMLQIIEETCKAPSALNMQPWRFVVVASPEGKSKLRPLVGPNTTQNDTSSAMILIFGDMKSWEKADEIYTEAVNKGFMSEKEKEAMMNRVLPMYEKMSETKLREMAKVDSSLAAMQLMLVARKHGYDTNPIGGFDASKLAETFGLDPKRYIPVIIIAIGKADYEIRKSVRLETEKLVKFL